MSDDEEAPAESPPADQEIDTIVAAAREYDEELAADIERHLADQQATLQDRADRIDALETKVEELTAETADLEAEVDDLTDRLKRKQADFENYKKRQQRKQEQIRERATEDLVERMLDVRDNLTRALEADDDDTESLREGIRMTVQSFDRVLDAEGVTKIDPDPGSEVDPRRHEVMMRVDAQQPEDTIAEVYTPGYAMGESILRPAQVTVSTGPTASDSDEQAAEEPSTD